MIQSITDETFRQEVLESAVPVLVDFWAPWCGPCHTMAPALAEFAQRHRARIKVVKVNIDNDPEHAMQLSIRSVPTLMLFERGAATKTVSGAQTLARLEAAFAV